MSSRTRLIVMSISAPVIVFAIVGGFLGKVMAGQDAPYQHLKIFDDVVSMISSQYVEEVNIDKVMHGAMHGLADGLDPDSAYLTPAQAKQVEAGTPLPPAGVGLELTRQYYLRVIAARDNSPAARRGSEPATTSAPSTICRPARCRCGKGCARCAALPARKSTSR